jgi:hypothetical protein
MSKSGSVVGINVILFSVFGSDTCTWTQSDLTPEGMGVVSIWDPLRRIGQNCAVSLNTGMKK